MADVSMAEIARRGVGGLFDTRGRDGRMQYWLFLLLVFGPLFVLQIILQFVLVMPPLDLVMATRPGAPATNTPFLEHQLRAMVTVIMSVLAFTCSARCC